MWYERWTEKRRLVREIHNHIFNADHSTGTLHPRHVIQATGHSGEANFPAHIEGLLDFQGDRLVHSSKFLGAPKNGKGKKAIVVGCCNSGHDIAQDFFENGFDVTMVQRSSTYVMSSKEGLDVLLGGLYEEGGVSAPDAVDLSAALIKPSTGYRCLSMTQT